ncbi:MAG: cyclic nucleotide-binding domain-containing protein [Ilumatobacteraceae bacterium]
MAGDRPLPPVRAALRNSDLRRAVIAYFASVISEWALWCGVLVYSYEHSGATTAGFVSLGLFLPGALIAPLAGAAADGPKPNRVLAIVYAVQAISLTIATAAAYLEGPLLTVIVPSAVALAMVAYIRPCFAVVVPGLVTSTGELTAANLLNGYCDSSSVLLGPLAASALIAIDGPPIVLAACAGLAVLGVVITLPLIRLDPKSAQGHPVRHGSRTGALVEGIRALAQRKGALQLMSVLGGQYVLIGALDLIYVVLATEEFELGASGPGLLGAAFGAGAILGGISSTVLVARKRLAPLLLMSLLAICGALALLGGVTTFAIALIVLPIAGISRSVLDVTGRMLMQRAAPQDALASVFAVEESLALTGCAVGCIIAQVAIAVAGARAALLAVGLVLALLLVVTGKRLAQVDASANAPVVAIRLLRRIPLFAPLPGPALEGVARAAQAVSIPSGQVILHEGEAGDSYFAIVTGEVAVTMGGEPVRTMARGEGFGEIALLADVPRTASVTASTDVELLEIERASFLTAVTGHDASQQAAWAIARTWHPVIDSAISSNGAAAR